MVGSIARALVASAQTTAEIRKQRWNFANMLREATKRRSLGQGNDGLTAWKTKDFDAIVEVWHMLP